MMDIPDIEISEIIASDLRHAAIQYEMSFRQPLPDLGQASDLELLLILERHLKNVGYVYPYDENIKSELQIVKAEYIKLFDREIPDWVWSDTRILAALKKALKTGVPYPTKEEEEIIKTELKNVEAKYEKKFKRRTPWWWICTDEERLQRLEKAIRVNQPYPEYSGNVIEKTETPFAFLGLNFEPVTYETRETYHLGKAIATYDMLHGRLPPEWFHHSDEEYLKRLSRKIYRVGTPYLTIEEEINLKTEYRRKFRVPMSDFKLSIERVDFRDGKAQGNSWSVISVARTATGAIARYGAEGIAGLKYKAPLELELSVEEWLDFINALHKHTAIWIRYPLQGTTRAYGSGQNLPWSLKIYTSDENEIDFCELKTYTQNWNRSEFKKLMSNMEARIKNNTVVERDLFLNRKISEQTETGTKENVGQEILGTNMNRGKLKTTGGVIAANSGLIVGLKSDNTIMIKDQDETHINKTVSWNNIVAISIGNRRVVGLKSDGTIMETYRACGYGRCKTNDWNNIISISANEDRTVGLKPNGTVMATGYNDFDECDVADWKNIIAISVGAFHTVGLKSDGTVVATGANTSGQLNVADWDNVIAITASKFHTVGLKSDGTVVATGRNWNGECNKVSKWNNIIAIAAGYFHTVGLKSDGTVVAVGNNEFGQCDISGWKNIVAIAASEYNTIGLRSDGTAVVAGAIGLDIPEWSGLKVMKTGASMASKGLFYNNISLPIILLICLIALDLMVNIFRRKKCKRKTFCA